jgi:hypothetical protein
MNEAITAWLNYPFAGAWVAGVVGLFIIVLVLVSAIAEERDRIKRQQWYIGQMESESARRARVWDEYHAMMDAVVIITGIAPSDDTTEPGAFARVGTDGNLYLHSLREPMEGPTGIIEVPYLKRIVPRGKWASFENVGDAAEPI